MKLLGLPLLAMAAALLRADNTAVNPARQLYDTGIRQTEEGKLADARATLRTLLDTYPQNPLAVDAKGAIDATLLFEEGQTRAKAGKYATARVAFATLIAVYPESPLAARANACLEAIAGKEKASHPIVQSMEFRDVDGVPPDEIRAALEAREVRLTVGQPYRSKDVPQAKLAVEQILAERGLAHARVEAKMRAIAPNSVAVIFTVEKPHASMLGAPWRLAMAGWHRVI